MRRVAFVGDSNFARRKDCETSPRPKPVEAAVLLDQSGGQGDAGDRPSLRERLLLGSWF
jgi:hypothetical protein